MSSENNIIIIGAGASGIGMGCQLQRKLGYDNFEIYEKGDNIGGTWYSNTYPGCACDIPSHFYSFSFEKNPNWSEVFSPQPEIHKYLLHVCDKYKLTSHIILSTECLGADWNKDLESWTVRFKNLKTGQTYSKTCRFLVVGAGVLSIPNSCPVPGIENFKGESWHSATWNHKVDLTDKKVVVIGNGCSATQFVPVILKKVKSLTQFIRSPHWIFRRPNYVYSERFKWIMRRIPGLMNLYRFLWAAIFEAQFSLFRTESGQWLRTIMSGVARKYMIAAAPEKYHDILIPEFEVGAKRRIFDNDYLVCLHDPKIQLTNDPLVQIKERSVLTKSGKEYPADVIVYANGFQIHEPFVPMVIRGKSGEDIRSRWKRQGGARAYMSIMVSDYPNLFTIAGPNSISGHYSVIYMIECNVNLILKLIKPFIKTGKKGFIEVKEEAEKKDVDWVQTRLKGCIWEKGETGWYVNKENKHNGTIYPHYQIHYWLRSLMPQWSDFNLKGAKPEYPVKVFLVIFAIIGILIAWLLAVMKIIQI